MTNAVKIKNELDAFFINLKAEVVVSELLENSKLSNEDITVRNRSSFSRSYRRDILDVSINTSDKLQIDLSRNGVYDALPQGIFHSKVNIDSPSSYSELRQKSKKEEADARMLFAPLENEFFLHKVFIERQEKKLALQFNNLENSFLLDFWGIKNKVDEEYIFLLAKALPLAYKISKNENLIAQCLSEILKEKVTIKKEFISLDNPTSINNEEYVLGVNTSLELRKTRVLHPYYYITIELTDIENKKKYSKKGIATELIRVFCGYFVPLEIDWEVKLTYNQSKMNFTLSDDSTFLGLSSTL